VDVADDGVSASPVGVAVTPHPTSRRNDTE
jgi:hypothetical protein